MCAPAMPGVAFGMLGRIGVDGGNADEYARFCRLDPHEHGHLALIVVHDLPLTSRPDVRITERHRSGKIRTLLLNMIVQVGESFVA
jgi:hypothetical protein